MNELDDKVTTHVPDIIVEPDIAKVPPTPAWLLYIASSFTAVWGLWFILPWDTFNSSNAFIMMQQMLPSEIAWGMFFFIAGSWKLWEISKQIKTGKPTRSHVFANFTIFILWTIVGVSVAFSDYRSTGSLTYMYFALLTLLSTAESLATYKVNREGR